nr:Fe-S oxidoreductase [Ureibacillus thermophilus]
MPVLTYEQLTFLNSYSIVTEEPKNPLFTLENIHKEFFLKDFLKLMMEITQASTEAAAISHFSCRFGLFVATQFYFLTAYDEIWDGKLEDVRYFHVLEYGMDTLGTYITPTDFRYVEENEREYVISKILYQAHQIIVQLRQTTTISPLTLWENIFGYMLWNYNVLLQNPLLADRAFEDIEILEDTKVWQRFSNKSWFFEYTKGKNPMELVNSPVRKSCCFTKDIPSLIQPLILCVHGDLVGLLLHVTQIFSPIGIPVDKKLDKFGLLIDNFYGALSKNRLSPFVLVGLFFYLLSLFYSILYPNLLYHND